MNIKMPFLCALLAAVFVGLPMQAPVKSYAQTPADSQAGKLPGMMSNSPSCRAAGEAIINLRNPFFGNPAVWDAAFGDHRGPVQFSGAVALENKNLLVAGDALDEAYLPQEMVLVELNSRARAVDEKRYPAKVAERSTGILPIAGGYAVSSTIHGGARAAEIWTRLAWYDSERKFLREIILKDSSFDYESMSLSPAANGKGIVAVVKAINRKDPKEQHGVLFRISDQGKILWKRSYRPGAANYIYGVSVADGDAYLAGGQIKSEDGRQAGWLLKLSDDGTIIWQNTYPRGQFAVFRSGTAKPVMYEADHYVVAGQVIPYGSDPAAAWLLEVDSNGKTIWQRYFRGIAIDFDGRDVMAHPDGRITLMANAKFHEGGDEAAKAPEHIRLITLSPRGVIMNDEGYMEGHGATAQQLIKGWGGERIVIATIEMNKQPGADKGVELITDALARKEKETAMAAADTLGPPTPTPEQMAIIAQSKKVETRREGWVFVATGLDPYEDPCLIPAAEPAQ